MEFSRSTCPPLQERERVIIALLGRESLDDIDIHWLIHVDDCNSCIEDKNAIENMGVDTYLSLRDGERSNDYLEPDL